MKKVVWVALTCAMILILAVCLAESTASQSEAASYQTITADEVKAMLDEGADFTLVDVRTASEYAEGHIPGAIHIANEEIVSEPPAVLADKDAAIVVYCRSGRRSKEATEKLLEMGYTNVRDMGGINSWTYETVAGAEAGSWAAEPVQEEADAAEEADETPSGLLSRFSATDLNGNPVDQSMLKGHKLTMVNVWATYCSPCLREMPDLGELAAEYSEKGVQIVGLVTDVINSDGSLSDTQIKTAQDVVAATKADYPHILPSQDLFGLLYQITSVPTTFFVDENGVQVGYAYLGSQSKDAWAAIIEETLAEVAQ